MFGMIPDQPTGYLEFCSRSWTSAESRPARCHAYCMV